ncbi:MAG: heme-binding protein [Pseudomonadales bacterium]|nr:heme-binding protein [Pseudomonadales bacterium]
MHLSSFFQRYGQVLVFLLTSHLAGHTMALEKPGYKVLYQEGKLEYRLYQPYIVAETEVVGEESYKAASNEGFMRLFRYISGGNVDQASIAMTAPVQRHRVSEEIAMTTPVQRLPTAQGWKVAFMLPSQYALDDAPVPVDPRVVIRPMPERLMAVLRYSGRWTERNLVKYEQRLRERLQEHGIEVMGVTESAAYNPPFTPPFMRRNEIMVKVEGYPTK